MPSASTRELVGLPWIAIALVAVVAALAAYRLAGRVARRAAVRAVHRHHARVNRFKLTRKSYIRTALLGDSEIEEAVHAHAGEHGLAEADAWRLVERYINEIVPHFNVLAYYNVAVSLSKLFLDFFYKISVDYEDLPSLERLPRDSIVIYLINHRSNADYVLITHVLAGDVSISYAVGEWARAFPLEYVFKSFGSYFVRRGFREPLYHKVLERYVQLVTRNGVTQGVFPEGGLSRDGRLRPAKIGLLDYALGVGRDPAAADRMVIVPIALNYDRVLEDRSLLRELETTERGVGGMGGVGGGGGRSGPSRLAQMREVFSYVIWNLGRIGVRRSKRYGRAAVTFGRPIALAGWFEEQRARHGNFFALPRSERLATVQGLMDGIMLRIAALIPVTPVTLACAAIQSLQGDFIPRRLLLERMAHMREVLIELNAKVLRAEGDIEQTFDRAWKMLRMRRILVSEGDGFAVLPKQRQLVTYYANSIAHLLGPFESGLRERDTLPADRFAFETQAAK